MYSNLTRGVLQQSLGRVRLLSTRTHPALSGETVRIGCSSGFWGDTAAAAPQLVEHGNIDFLVSDYLSEITMSLLVGAQRKSPDMGYAPDFVHQCMKPLLKGIKSKGIQVVTNAGGINPEGCVQALKKIASSQGVDLSIAMVTGDNMRDQLEAVRASGLAREIDTGAPLPGSLVSMNAYFGAFPIARALNAGADVVVTGRCVDSALGLAPLIHKFGWKEGDLDLLAAGSLAGHLIECGAQATGGIFTDWHTVDGWDNIGFPVVECSADGQFVITKPPNTGGLVSTATVAEQMVYEIGDPASYVLPDVSCDFSGVVLTQLQKDEVLVSGAKGKAPPSDYKVSATYMDGYRATGVSPLIGPRAVEKALKNAEAIINRTRRMFKVLGFQDYTKTYVHALGSDASYGPHAQPVQSGREAVLWLAVEHQQKEALEVFAREIAPAGTGMSPGSTALIGGRPRASPVLKLFSFLYPKEKFQVSVVKDGEQVASEETSGTSSGYKPSPNPPVSSSHSGPVNTGSHQHRVEELAYLRSGDKGNSANIGVIARKPQYYAYLKKHLTEEVVSDWFAHLIEPLDNETPAGLVRRYELPGVNGLNFVLRRSLGGGGVSSLRCDPQGKAYGQMLADYIISDLPPLEDM